MPTPEELRDALTRVNAARAKVGSPPFRLDPRLTKAAQEHADGLAAGTQRPHQGFPDRVWKDGGYPQCNLNNPHISFGNISEGVFEGGYEEQDWINDFLVHEKGRETHGGDMREPLFTDIGIGFASGPGNLQKDDHGWMVYDYGSTCGQPDPGPSPTPTPPQPTPPTPPGPLPTPPAPAPGPLPDVTVVRRLMDAHNAERSRHGAGPLHISLPLMRSAAFEASDGARTGRLSHTSSDGRDPFRRMHDEGYSYEWAGENIAEGQPDVNSVMQAWMSDAGHRGNILNPHFTGVGFGVVEDSRGRLWWAADFGSPQGAEPDPFARDNDPGEPPVVPRVTYRAFGPHPLFDYYANLVPPEDEDEDQSPVVPVATAAGGEPDAPREPLPLGGSGGHAGGLSGRASSVSAVRHPRHGTLLARPGGRYVAPRPVRQSGGAGQPD